MATVHFSDLTKDYLLVLYLFIICIFISSVEKLYYKTKRMNSFISFFTEKNIKEKNSSLHCNDKREKEERSVNERINSLVLHWLSKTTHLTQTIICIKIRTLFWFASITIINTMSHKVNNVTYKKTIGNYGAIATYPIVHFISNKYMSHGQSDFLNHCFTCIFVYI